jgi:hypothetical protein
MQVFSECLGFPLLNLIPPIALHSSSSFAGTIGQVVAQVPTGFSFTPAEETIKKRD